jgi:hypothetical protein
MFNIIVCQKCDISIGSDSIFIYVACCKGGGISAAMFLILLLFLPLLQLQLQLQLLLLFNGRPRQ